MAEAGVRAKLAERRGNDALAHAEWRRYRLIRDVGRSPDELLAEGIELSERAAEFAAAAK
jgi:negative regulator of sigma E activity